MSASLEERIRGRLAAIEAAGEQRHLESPHGVDLCSNDYLGLATHPLLRSRMAEAVEQEGCGATAARLLRGERNCFSQLERRFAAFKGTERSLFFGSGYAANLGMLTTFLEPGDVVFSDSLNHASLIDGMRLAKAERVIFPHLEVDSLARLLRDTPCTGRKFLVTESLFSMDGDVAPLTEYAKLCRESNALMLVDEAHAVGIYGEQGSGLIEATGTAKDVFLSMNTAGKALGTAGAFVAGPAWAIEYLVQRARSFMFSTAPPPALAAAIDAALEIVAAEPERRHRLRQNVALLRKLLSDHNIQLPNDETQIIPILIGDSRRAVAIAEQLQSEGYDVRAVRPPTVPEGTARLRLSLNSELTAAQLGGLAHAINRSGISRSNLAATG